MKKILDAETTKILAWQLISTSTALRAEQARYWVSTVDGRHGLMEIDLWRVYDKDPAWCQVILPVPGGATRLNAKQVELPMSLRDEILHGAFKVSLDQINDQLWEKCPWPELGHLWRQMATGGLPKSPRSVEGISSAYKKLPSFSEDDPHDTHVVENLKRLAAELRRSRKKELKTTRKAQPTTVYDRTLRSILSAVESAGYIAGCDEVRAQLLAAAELICQKMDPMKRKARTVKKAAKGKAKKEGGNE